VPQIWNNDSYQSKNSYQGKGSYQGKVRIRACLQACHTRTQLMSGFSRCGSGK